MKSMKRLQIDSCQILHVVNWHGLAEQVGRNKMPCKASKFVIGLNVSIMRHVFAILFSFLLIGSNPTALAVVLGQLCPVSEATCCCSDCDTMMSCCEKNEDSPHSSLPPTNQLSQNLLFLEIQPVSLSQVKSLGLGLKLPKSDSYVSQSVPIFKRHCRFLI